MDRQAEQRLIAAMIRRRIFEASEWLAGAAVWTAVASLIAVGIQLKRRVDLLVLAIVLGLIAMLILAIVYWAS